MILFHLAPTGRLLGATGLRGAQSIGRDIRAAQARSRIAKAGRVRVAARNHRLTGARAAAR
ncbi:MAG: hypothetical protein ACREFP_24425 [Acetobacteraceae bacterium]